jgi:type VI secretion system protein ImpJ
LLRSAATPGVPIQATHRPPAEIPVRAGVTYFQLNLQNDYWRSIQQEKGVAIYLPPPFDPAHVKLELLAVPRTV